MGARVPVPGFTSDSMALDERFGLEREFAAIARERIGVGPGDRVLDVGCGAGGFSRFLLPSLEGRGALVGVDRDPELLDEARRATRAPPGVDVGFERGDAFALPFPDASFDVVASQFLLCVLPKPIDALLEMVRVAKPGARVASVSCFCKSGGLPQFYGDAEWPGKARFEELAARFWPAYRTTVRNPGLGLPNGRDLDVWADAHRAGLVDLAMTGFLATQAPGDARWSPEEALEYADRRERIQLGLLDRLDEASFAKIAAAGFAPSEAKELRDLTARRWEAVRREIRAGRRPTDVLVDPSVLIVGRVPAA